MNADRTLLTDAHWALLAPLLPGCGGRRGVVAKDNRGFVEAVRWVGRTGLPWRDLPPDLGQWHRVFVRFSRWRTRGVWAHIRGRGAEKKAKQAGKRARRWIVERTHYSWLNRYRHLLIRWAKKPDNHGLG